VYLEAGEWRGGYSEATSLRDRGDVDVEPLAGEVAKEKLLPLCETSFWRNISVYRNGKSHGSQLY